VSTAPFFLTPPASAEVGDDVTLEGGAQTLTGLELRYAGGFDADGDETVQLRLYTAEGPDGAPDALLYESAVIPIDPSTFSGTSVVVDGLSVEVPGELVWTLEFEGISQNDSDQVMLRFYDPPEVGGSDPSFVWMRSSPAVAWSKQSLSSANMYALITAAPEPSAAALQLAAGLALAALRRTARGGRQGSAR